METTTALTAADNPFAPHIVLEQPAGKQTSSCLQEREVNETGLHEALIYSTDVSQENVL